MHILVDMDDTIANWQDSFDTYLATYYEDAANIPRKDDRTCFDLHKDRTERESEIINDIMDMEGFYADLEPIYGAIDAVKSMLEAGHEVSLVTSPWLSNPTCVQDKYEWVRKYLGDDWVDRVIITKDKTLIEGDILIDDKPEITGKAVPKWTQVVFDQPYNRYFDNPYRLFSWADWEQELFWANVAEKDLPDEFPVTVNSSLGKFPSTMGEIREGDEVRKMIHRDLKETLKAEVRMTSSTGGQKGKKLAELGSLDPNSLLKVAEVAGFGSQKYDRLNYMKGYEWSLSFDAMQRHLLAFWAGQDKDDESEMLHLAHAAWHCLTMISFVERGLGTDDRYTSMSISQFQTKEIK